MTNKVEIPEDYIYERRGIIHFIESEMDEIPYEEEIIEVYIYDAIAEDNEDRVADDDDEASMLLGVDCERIGDEEYIINVGMANYDMEAGAYEEEILISNKLIHKIVKSMGAQVSNIERSQGIQSGAMIYLTTFKMTEYRLDIDRTLTSEADMEDIYGTEGLSDEEIELENSVAEEVEKTLANVLPDESANTSNGDDANEIKD